MLSSMRGRCHVADRVLSGDKSPGRDARTGCGGTAEARATDLAMTLRPNTLTVVTCTHNRSELLLRTLGYLHRANRPPNWEVVLLVAANACTDDTQAVLERLGSNAESALPLTWVAVPTAGKSRALNEVVPSITSELVTFVDDDHRVDAEYLVGICAAAEEYPEADLFCGRIVPDWDGSEPAWVHDAGPYRIYPLPVPRFDKGGKPMPLTPEIAIPGGGNLFLRTEWLSRVGPFSTDLGPAGHDLGGSEDLDWILRAQRMGARLQYVPRVVQYHYVDVRRLTLPYLLRKAYKRTSSTVGLDSQIQCVGVPRYLYRKLAEYLFAAVATLNPSKRRFFLVRSAAALGEIAGHRRIRRGGKPPAQETLSAD